MKVRKRPASEEMHLHPFGFNQMDSTVVSGKTGKMQEHRDGSHKSNESHEFLMPITALTIGTVRARAGMALAGSPAK